MSIVDVQLLQDRLDVVDTVYRYASTIDAFDTAGLRSIFADDLWAQYGNGSPIIGGDAVAERIWKGVANYAWQHHLLSVYHTTIDGDGASALAYHTSHQIEKDDLSNVLMLIGRYHVRLRRTESGWVFSKLIFELLWSERRSDTGDLARKGGTGPHPLPTLD
jgi:ketosteroid isomerase-like protein